MLRGEDAMAGMVQSVLGFIDEHFNLLYIIIPAAIAVVLMLIPSKMTNLWGIGIFVVLILLCIVYLMMMVVGAGIVYERTPSKGDGVISFFWGGLH